MTDYAVLLNEHGLKATFQRMNILGEIDRHGHMSVEDIYEKVVKVHPSLSLATIYKNIILMVEKEVLVEVPIVGKKSKYELELHKRQVNLYGICEHCQSKIA